MPRSTRSRTLAVPGVRVGQVEVDGLGGRGLGDLGLVAGGLEPHERRAGLDLAADADEELAHARREGRRQHRLHLHRLEDEHRGTGGHLVADGGRGRDDERGRGRPHDAALVARDAVGDAVDLDEVDGPVGGGDEAVRASLDDDAAGILVDAVERRVDDVLVAAVGDGDAVAVATRCAAP